MKQVSVTKLLLSISLVIKPTQGIRKLELTEVIMATSSSFKWRHILMSARDSSIFWTDVVLESIWPELSRQTGANEECTDAILNSEMVAFQGVLTRRISSSGVDFVPI